MIIGNGYLLTNDAEHHILKMAQSVSRRFRRSNRRDDALREKYPEDEFIDAEGRVIMPGMINSHTHIYSAYARGMSVSGPTTNFPEILENMWWALDRRLTMEDNTLSAYLTYIESIRNGVTTLFDHHASPHAAKGSLLRSPKRQRTSVSALLFLGDIRSRR